MVCLNRIAVTPFQSTLPHGSDLSNFVSYRDLSDFNPRSLAGATYEAPACPFDTDISIHAPSRERLCQSFFIVGFSYFNPRSLTGATSIMNLPKLKSKLFQSTLPHGSDRKHTVSASHHVISIHAPAQAIVVSAARISIHAPLRERP